MIRAAQLTLSACLLAVLGVALAPSPAAAFRPRPVLEVTSPVHGVFSTAATVNVVGRVRNKQAGTVLTVNGTVVPMNPDGTFSHPVTLNPSIVFNPIETRVAAPFLIDRRVVIAGQSVADGDLSLNSLALRLNDSGLDQLEPVVTGLVDLDLATLLPPGTLVINNYCYASIFGACIGRVDATVEGSPPPSIGSFGINIDSQPGFAFGDILLNNLFVRARVQAVSGIGFTCFVNISAATTDIEGNYNLQPLAGDPSNVDVVQLGSANVIFGGFSDTTDCSGFLGGVVEFFIDLLVGDIQDLMQPAFEDFLNETDAAGNTAVAGAIEAALQGIEIAGPIGESLNAVLSAPLFAVTEDATGITLGSHASVVAQLGTPGCPPPPGTAELSASLHVPEAFPSFGANAPGGAPYDLAIAISTSAFNQLLKAQVECGLLQAELTEFELFGGTVPLTAGLLSLLLPEFASLPPTLAMVARIKPSLAPVLTGNTGPLGELTEMRLGQLSVDLRAHPSTGIDLSYLNLAIDFRVGLDFAFAGGQLAPTISAIDENDVVASVQSSFFGTVTPEDVQVAVPALVQGALPVLSESLGSFPIPAFFGFQLDPVETGLNGDFLAIFADLTPAP